MSSGGNCLEHASTTPFAAWTATTSAPGGACVGGNQANEKRKPPFRPVPDDTKLQARPSRPDLAVRPVEAEQAVLLPPSFPRAAS